MNFTTLKGTHMSDDILDLAPTEIEDIRNHPDGRYKGVMVDYEIGKSPSGKQYVQFFFRAEEALEGQDLTGVELNRRLRSERQWLTREAAKYTKQRLTQFGVQEADSMRQWIEDCVGANVTFNLETKASETNPEKSYQNVTSWRAA
jgi:uncharacterized protein (DUF1778 family)